MSLRVPTYSVVIPAYRSGAWMDELAARIGATLDACTPGDYEVIVVDDCSPDTETWPAIQRNALRHPWLRGFSLLCNVGQFRATLCGMAQARGAFVLTMDDDLQHLPEELPKLIDAMRADPETLCVMGAFAAKRHSAFRNVGSRLYHRLMSRLYGQDPGLQTTAFRILRRELVEAILTFRTARPQITPQIAALTKKVRNVDVAHAPRSKGRSGYSLWRLGATTVDNVVHGSTAPLRFFSVVGIVCAALSGVLGAFYLVRRLTGDIRVPGFATQTLLIVFFGGMTLAGVGVLGEYIARIIAEVTGPERFRIRRQTETVPRETDHDGA